MTHRSIKQHTTAPVSTAYGAQLKPEFLPVPANGRRCPVSGLSRAYIYKLIAEGKIQSVAIRERGKTRGKRLVVFDSLMAFLRSQIEVVPVAPEGGAA